MMTLIVAFHNFEITWTNRINLRNYNGMAFVGKRDDTREVRRSKREREDNIKKYLREIVCRLGSEFMCGSG
jgi:hypothetical protein